MRHAVAVTVVTAGLGLLACAVLAPSDPESPTASTSAPAQQLASGVSPAIELVPEARSEQPRAAAAPASAASTSPASQTRSQARSSRAASAASAVRRAPAPAAPQVHEPYGVSKLRAALQGQPFQPTVAQVAARTERLERKLARRDRVEQARRALGFEADDPAARELEDLLGAGPGLFESLRAEADPQAELARLLDD